VEESLRLLKDIYEIPEARYRENMELFKDVFGLSEFLTRPARRISLGQRMRADLAASLLHDPKVLYLDEPTIGLDISVKESMRKFIQMINRERGTTVILTSHDLTDIENLCERVIVIDEGKIICDEKISSLAELYAHERGVRITLKRPDGGIAAALAKYPALRPDYDGGHTLSIMFDIADYSAYEVISIVGGISEIQDIQLMEPDIKEVIAKIYKSELKASPV
jgi:ABC-2 type transport system ATP-binding protein